MKDIEIDRERINYKTTDCCQREVTETWREKMDEKKESLRPRERQRDRETER